METIYRKGRVMKSIFPIIVAIFIISVSTCSAEEEPATELSTKGFKITKVMNEPRKLNALGKMSEFTDSNAVGKETELGRELPASEQGEEFIVKWRYSGSVAVPEVTVKIEYVTGMKPEIQIFERVYAGVKKKSYEITLRNTGSNYEKQGEIAHWRVTIRRGNKVLASKQSAMWSSLETFAEGAKLEK